jgi:hypothetical protein
VHHVTVEGIVEGGGHALVELSPARIDIKGYNGTTSRRLKVKFTGLSQNSQADPAV